MNYASKQTVMSKLINGVSYTLLKMSHGRRAAYSVAMAHALAKQADIQREYATLSDRKRERAKAAALEPCVCVDHPHAPGDSQQCSVDGCKCREAHDAAEAEGIAALEQSLAELVVGEINPALVKWGLAEIAGLLIDGRPATPESLLADGPEDLVHEIASEVSRLLRVSPAETENFASPSTSGALADGPTSDSTAPSASAAVTT